MTTLYDPFAVTHKKPVKTKDGRTNYLDYIQWTDAADRLDECAPGWSFSILGVGPDWVHGRLVLADGRAIENIGYAESAEASWKKEVLKDATSDAFKRCAAMLGVGRYLYDREDGPTTQAQAAGASSPAPTRGPAPEAGRATTRPAPAQSSDADHCPVHGDAWVHKTGVGKASGKPYDFWTCPAKDDDGWCKKGPERGWQPPAPPAPPARDEEDDLDALPF